MEIAELRSTANPISTNDDQRQLAPLITPDLEKLQNVFSKQIEIILQGYQGLAALMNQFRGNNSLDFFTDKMAEFDSKISSIMNKTNGKPKTRSSSAGAATKRKHQDSPLVATKDFLWQEENTNDETQKRKHDKSHPYKKSDFVVTPTNTDSNEALKSPRKKKNKGQGKNSKNLHPANIRNILESENAQKTREKTGEEASEGHVETPPPMEIVAAEYDSRTHNEIDNQMETKNDKDTKDISENISILRQENIKYKILEKKGKSIPPFFIQDDEVDWFSLKEKLNKLQIDFRGHINTSGIRVNVFSEEDFRKVQALLDAEKIKFHTYMLKTDKPVKVIIRHLPTSTKPEAIQEELLAMDFPVTNVTQFKSRRDGEIKPIPIFLVTLTRTEKASDIYHLHGMFHLKIKVETYKGRQGPAQCHNCQKFYHGQSSCRMPPKCCRCAGDHKTTDCNREINTVIKCINCKGDHVSSWRGCPLNPKNIALEQQKSEIEEKLQFPTRTFTGKSFAEATRVHPGIQNTDIAMAKELRRTSASAKILVNQLMTLIGWIKETKIIDNITKLVTSSEVLKMLETSENIPDHE